MADLLAYINFRATIDVSQTTPVIFLEDIGNYPSSVTPTITGIFAVTQADGVTVTGNFTTPDITYASGVLGSSTKPYRVATDNGVQSGNYSITYTVRAAGYTDTVLTKAFAINYTKSSVVVNDTINPFTPLFTIEDNTDYNKNGLTISSITRSWLANISTVNGTPQLLIGSSKLFTVSFGGLYFDAVYNTKLRTVIVYNLQSNAAIFIKDAVSITGNYDLYTPPTLEQLLSCVNDLDTSCGCNKGDILCKAVLLYHNYFNSGRKGKTADLYATVVKLQALFSCDCAVKNTVHTSNPINIYNWNYVTIATDIAPVIITQPQGLTVNNGADISLSVSAIGSAPLAYQWQKSVSGVFTNIVGANASILNLTNIINSNAGIYRVVVTNAFGTATSNEASLVINTSLTAYYAYTSVDPFTALSSGTDALTYQVSQPFIHNANVSVTLPSAGANNNFGVVKVPTGQPLKTTWYNTPFNNGSIPDSVFRAVVTIGSFNYYITRDAWSYDNSSPLILG